MGLAVPGLINAGDNTCFLNSVLQALASSQSTVAAFNSADRRQKAASNWPSQSQGTLVTTLADLLQGLQLDPDNTSSSPSTLSSRNVADALREHSAAALLCAGDQNDAVEALELLAASAEAEMQRSCREATRQLAEAVTLCVAPPRGLALLVAPVTGIVRKVDADDRDGVGTDAVVSSREAETAAVDTYVQGCQAAGLLKAAVFIELCSALREWRQGSQLPLQGWQAHQLVCARCGSASVTQLLPFYVLSLALPHTGRWLRPGCSVERCLQSLASWELLDHVNCVRCSLKQAVQPVQPVQSKAATCNAPAQEQPARASSTAGETEDGQSKCVPSDSETVSSTDCGQEREAAEMLKRLCELASSSGPSPDCDWEHITAAAGLQWNVRRSPALKRITIARAPQMLCLQLRRAFWSPVTGTHVKLSGHVSFPMQLDLRSYNGLGDCPEHPSSAASAPLPGYNTPTSSSLGGDGSRNLPMTTPSSESSLGSTFLRQLTAVKAAREAARHAGVPEHEVTGVRLRIKAQDGDDAPSLQGKVDADKLDLDAHHVGGVGSENSPSEHEYPCASATASSSESRCEASQSSMPGSHSGETAVLRSKSRVSKVSDQLQCSDTAGLEEKHAAFVTGKRQSEAGARVQSFDYDLVAVVVHYGSSSSGHYTTFRRIRDDSRWRWLGISDADVREVDEHVVLACEATLLCYERSGIKGVC